MGGIENTEIETEEDVVRLVKDCRAQATSSQGEWRDETRTSYDMVSGKQWTDEEEATLQEEERIPTTFNFIGTTIDAVSGSEINNRQEVAYIPREIGDVSKDELMTAAAQWVRDNCDAEDEESDSFWDVLIGGVAWTETRMDYEQDEEGKCFIERVDPFEMRWDPSARKRNLADAKWVQRERRFTKEDIEALWPEKASDLKAGTDFDEDDDESPHVNHEPDGYSGDSKSGAERGKKLYTVIQHQWYTLECYYKVLSPDSGQIVELSKEKFEALEKAQMAANIPPPESARLHRRVYKQAFVSGETLLEVKDAPCKEDFTFQAITGKRDRNKGTWYGLVRPMKDPQKWANKFYSLLIHILNTNAKGGLMMEEGAVANPRKFEADWSKTNKISKLNPGGLGKVMPKPPPAIPQIIGELMHFSVDSVRGTSGVNLELLGLADREQAGTLENQRTKAGLTILAPFFGSLRHYRKRQGRVLFYFIQNYMSDGRLIRVAGEGLGQFVPLIREPGVLKYDVVVDDAPTSRDTKERTWQALTQLMPLLKGEGIPIPPEVIEYAPLPSALIAKWKPMLEQAHQKAQQGDPMQKAMQEAQIEKIRAEVEKGYASADQAQSQAQLNYIKAQVESMAPVLQAIQMALQAFVPKPGPGGEQAPQGQTMQPQMPPMQPPMQQPPMGGAGPTPFQ
jgi:hypothetical protein